MVNKITDILEEVPGNKISVVLEIVSQELPTSIALHEFIKAVLFWRKEDSSFDATFYWYAKNIASGVFVGILNSGCQKPGIFVYAANGYEYLLEQVLTSTKKIDWKLLPLFHSVLPRLVDLVENVIERKHFAHELCFNGMIVSTDPETVSTYKPVLPSDVYAAKLKAKNINSIYDCWSSSHMYSKDMIRYAVLHEHSIGIFSIETDELLSWCILSSYGAVGALQTLEKARGKGYGKKTVMLMTKELIKSSFVPFSIVLEDNKASLATFESIGFKRNTEVRYIQVVPLVGLNSNL